MAGLDDRPHALYRFYDEAETLLYVGITLNPGRRWANHREEKAWWQDVALIRSETHPSRAAALAAERRAITEERPLHNVVHNRERLAQPGAEPKVIWLCDACNEPVGRTAGYIHINERAVMRHEEEWARFREAHPPGVVMSMADLLSAPARPSWEVHHRTCDPRPEASDYSIEIAEIDTYKKVIDWAAHMFNKTWITATEWDALLYRSIGGPL